MEKIKLFVAETYHSDKSEPSIVIKDELTQDELAMLNSAFAVCSLYHSITQIKDKIISWIMSDNFNIFKIPYGRRG